MKSLIIRFNMLREDFDYSYYIAKAANQQRLRGQSLVLDETRMRIDIEGDEASFEPFLKTFEQSPLKDKISEFTTEDGEIRNFFNFEMKKVKSPKVKTKSKSFIQFFKDIPDIFRTKLS